MSLFSPDTQPQRESDFLVRPRKRFVVPPELDGQRLDVVLARLAEQTRSQVKILIDEQRVWVDNVNKKAGSVVRMGDAVEFLPLSPVPTRALPQNLPLEVLYEDEYLAAINKPPGMVVHPAPGQWEDTVVNALLFRWGWTEQMATCRPGIVHRLDKDTSGVLLVAKDQRTLEQLSQAFKERRVRKTYVAVALGRFRPLAGKIELSIGRHPTDRKKMAARARDGRAAVSRYKVIEESGALSLLRLFPETGRTHQLRVHLAAIGHPILGDRVYGGTTGPHVKGLTPVAQTFPRQALHAEEIELLHPISQTTLRVWASYPEDLRQLLTLFPESLKRMKTSLLPVDEAEKIDYH